MNLPMPAAGLRVLLVEDEPIVAVLTEDSLDSIGCIVAGTVATVAEARAALGSVAFDVVLLDVNLDGDSGLALVPEFDARGIRYAITSGYGGEGLARDHPHVPMLSKPYTIAELENALCRCAGRV